MKKKKSKIDKLDLLNIDELQELLLKKLENISEKKFLEFAAGWIGEEELWEQVQDSIKDYDDEFVLRDAIKLLK